MTNKPTEKKETTTIFKRAEAAQNRLESLKQDFEEKVAVCSEKTALVNRLKTTMAELEQEIYWEDKKNRIPVNPRDGERCKELADQIALAVENHQQSSNELTLLNKEISELEKELKGLESNVPASELVSLQESCNAAFEKVISLKDAIVVQEEAKQKAKSAVPSILELDQERENLLAKIALGEASQNDLSNFDKKYAKELASKRKAEENADSVASSANQTIAGLRRCLTEAERELNSLLNQRDSARFCFLRGEIERVGNDYLELANALIEKYKRILGLELLMRGFTQNPKIKTANSNLFKIPMFNIKAFQSQLAKAPSGTLPEAENATFPHSLNDYAMAEKERIARLGIAWD